jgi:hypothetical protein
MLSAAVITTAVLMISAARARRDDGAVPVP